MRQRQGERAAAASEGAASQSVDYEVMDVRALTWADGTLDSVVDKARAPFRASAAPGRQTPSQGYLAGDAGHAAESGRRRGGGAPDGGGGGESAALRGSFPLHLARRRPAADAHGHGAGSRAGGGGRAALEACRAMRGVDSLPERDLPQLRLPRSSFALLVSRRRLCCQVRKNKASFWAYVLSKT